MRYFCLCGLIEYSCVNILPQITLITQRNAASCIISQIKTGWLLWLLWLLELWVLWFVCVICEICGRHWGFVCAIYLEYSHVNILPQIALITQRNTAKLYYFAEKDRLVWFMCFWGLGFCLRRSARSAGDIGRYSSLIVFLYKRNDIVGN